MIPLCLIFISRALKSDVNVINSSNINLTVLLFGRFFPIMSADNEKVGELQVSLVLESLMGRSFVSLFWQIKK